MLPLFLKWLGRQISLVGEVEKLRDEMDRLRTDLCEMREDLLRSQSETEIKLAQETAAREKFMLQVQNLLLQWERRLPQSGATPSVKRRKRAKRGG